MCARGAPYEALLLERSVDYLMSDDDEPVPEIRIQNKPLAERIRLLDSLNEEDQQALMRIIDSILTKKKMMDVLSNKAARSGLKKAGERKKTRTPLKLRAFLFAV